jgi:hypothetical protein
MTLLVFKLILTPALIVAVSLAVRRWGPKAGGLLAGLPLTSAPVFAFLAVEQGPAFATRAAAGTLSGVGSVGAFCLAYAVVAKHYGWVVCTSVGIMCFLLFTGIFHLVDLGLISGVIVTVGFLGVVIAAFPHALAKSATRQPPAWDLPGRAIAATALVLLLTGAAPTLGAYLSGLLSPFPVFANVLAAFSHTHDGPEASILLLRGIVLASFGFAGFFLVASWGLPRWGLTTALAIAALVAMATNWTAYQIDHAA